MPDTGAAFDALAPVLVPTLSFPGPVTGPRIFE